MPEILHSELPVRNLLGVEDAGLVTESRAIPAGQGLLKAGTLLRADGNRGLATDTNQLHSVLAFDVDTGPAGTQGTVPVTRYLAGSFLRTTVEAASGFVLNVNQITQIRFNGIFLERSVG